MRTEITEIHATAYTRRVSVYLDGIEEEYKSEIAGMLRGLMCAIEGWGVIAGLTNDAFNDNSPVIATFTNVERALYFKECVEDYFSSAVLENLTIKRRRRKM